MVAPDVWQTASHLRPKAYFNPHGGGKLTSNPGAASGITIWLSVTEIQIVDV
jgi:hypothetical protein